MPYLVQKFGGTSVATVERIGLVAKRIISAKRAGFDVVVVVSAMAKETDRLFHLAETFSSNPDRRERDVLASTGETLASALTALALQSEGVRARSLLGFQLPILTDSSAEARILSVESAPILECFQRGEIPVIAGFQGVDGQGRITTLGRGGSDTTAVAVAAALGGARCEIYTDVDGVFSVDPRLCSEATLLPQVSYRFMIEAAGLGAKVMHGRSVIMGMRYSVPISVKNSFHDSLGTDIGKSETPVNCVTVDNSVAQVSFLSTQTLGEFGDALSKMSVPFAMLQQTSSYEKVVVVPQSSVAELAEGFRFKGSILFSDSEVAKVSLVGTLGLDPGIQIPKVLSLMNHRQIKCQGLSAGHMSVSFLVPANQSLKTVQLIHSLFATSVPEEPSCLSL